MGKANSPDDGRDIVFKRRESDDKSTREWIIQCKLIRNNNSLKASKIIDIGDIIDRHNAGGYGVMTSGIIDSKLHDKLDNIGRKRGIKIIKYSRLELEHWLAKHPDIRARYFEI